MAILIEETKRVLVQGITGRERAGSHEADARIRDERCRGRAGERRANCAWRACVQHGARSSESAGGHRYFGAFCARGGVKEAAIRDCADIHLSGAVLRAPELFPKMNEQG